MWVEEILGSDIDEVRYVDGNEVYIERSVLYIGRSFRDVLRVVTLIGSINVDEPRSWLAVALSSYQGWGMLCDRLGEARARRILMSGSDMLFLIRYSVAHILMAIGAILAFRERGISLRRLRDLLYTVGVDSDAIESVHQLPSVLESLFPPDVLDSESLSRFIKR